MTGSPPDGYSFSPHRIIGIPGYVSGVTIRIARSTLFLPQHGLSGAHPNYPSVLSPYLGGRGLRPDSDGWMDSPRSRQWILLP